MLSLPDCKVHVTLWAKQQRRMVEFENAHEDHQMIELSEQGTPVGHV